MKTRKTYGINGLLEWHGYVESNGIRMKVDFTNGSVTAYGVSPCTFTTQDELTQFIMENSSQFKEGRIRVVRVVPLPGEEEAAPVEAEPVKQEEAAPQAEPTKEENKDKEVSVANAADAKQYLVENFGEKPSSLRSKDAIFKAAARHGITFKGI